MMIVPVLANVAAPQILTLTGNVLIVFSIIPVEFLVLWLLFHRFFKVQIGVPKLLLVTIVTNIATSIIGIPFAFNNSFASSPGTAFFVLPILFIFTWFIEGSLYSPLLKSKSYRISKRQLRLGAFWSNLASYAIFVLVLLPVSTPFNLFWQPNPLRANWEVKLAIGNILSYQQVFYDETSKFASSFKELPDSPQAYGFFNETQIPTDSQIENQFHYFKIDGDSEKATVKAAAKAKNLNSYTGIVFVVKEKPEPEFIRGICKTDQPSTVPPTSPQLKDGKIQCPSGSSLL
ncbi:MULTISPECIES: type IV pilin-like G/H family protein [unclassified Coleofasciculus]|uniref:type IV pilin-like G/H family protein n=1 Tax=unclassified Coleofasciculus TaxID=2692782 RepID=UPI0018813FEA|nr:MULTISPECIES: type IV pilin-like G/H family protein [unclassified Coleofasciculus]MBE9127207.1 type IV pilin-like G/H family protein [Coleofasciculus sp. LEGE 07081]MBE9150317.1 type IV pilin-like G/H family protein [Coleofasciculus sp. LEGE 07092]